MKTLFQLHKQKEAELGRRIFNSEVAKGAKVAHSTYACLIRGKLTPGSKVVEQKTRNKIASYFGVEADTITWPS